MILKLWILRLYKTRIRFIHGTTTRSTNQYILTARCRQPSCTTYKLANSNNCNSSRCVTLANSAETWGKNWCHTRPIKSSEILNWIQLILHSVQLWVYSNGLLWRPVHKISVTQTVHHAEHLNVMELPAEEHGRFIFMLSFQLGTVRELMVQYRQKALYHLTGRTYVFDKRDRSKV